MDSKRPAGFTLIEILVVLVVVGFGIGMVTLAVGDGEGKEMRDIAQRFTSQLHLAAENAAFGGEPMGVKWTEPQGQRGWRYAWYRFRDDEWLAADEPLLETQLPDYVDMLLQVDGEDVTDFSAENLAPPVLSPEAPQQRVRDDREEQLVPDIVLFASGEATPFSVEFSLRETSEHNQFIEVDLLGRITWEQGESNRRAREELQGDEDEN